MKSKILKKIINVCAIGAAVSVGISSCTKLDEYNPTALTEDVVLSKFDGWKSYQSNCYSGLWGSLVSMQYGLQSELGTDLWTFPYNNHNTYRFLTAYEELTDNANIVRNVWDFAWGSIKDCNKSIQLAPNLLDGDPAQIKILVAETKLLRAYYYSVLVAHYGNVPLIVTYNPVQDLNPKRSTIPELYAQIIKDLRDAFNDLPVTPLDNNPQRVTKKAALGLMARTYAQGGGEALSEGSKTYWTRAKEVADTLINNMGAYNAAMYDDFAKVFAAANNRNNAEVLFTAYGLNPYNASFDYNTSAARPNLYLHYYPKFDDAFGTGDIFKKAVNPNTSNAYYGRCNQQVIAPTKYLINCFNADYDKRWEHTFVTAFTNYSGVQAIANLGSAVPTPANVTYANATITLTAAMCTKYGIDASHIGEKIYPYADVNARNASQNATWQYIPKIWNKGDHTGNTTALTEISNANVHPYPLAADEDRFIAYLSKKPLTAEEKKARRYVTVNIDDLFDNSDVTGSTYKANISTNGLVPSTLATLFPAMQKFNHNFDGGWVGSNFQQKLGNLMIIRMAEIYLIAAEASLHGTGGGGSAAQYLNEIRKRACRNAADFNTATGMQLTSASMDDVFDEYARELCGEFNRWALLKRNKAFEARLAKYNKKAATNFVPAKHYVRPIPFTFLNQIQNADEFGNNGY